MWEHPNFYNSKMKQHARHLKQVSLDNIIHIKRWWGIICFIARELTTVYSSILVWLFSPRCSCNTISYIRWLYKRKGSQRWNIQEDMGRELQCTSLEPTTNSQNTSRNPLPFADAIGTEWTAQLYRHIRRASSSWFLKYKQISSFSHIGKIVHLTMWLSQPCTSNQLDHRLNQLCGYYF